MPADGGRRLLRLARRLRGSAGRLAPRQRDRDLVRRSGVIDRIWLEAQLGIELDSDGDAIDAYLAAGPSVSPHPLFEPAWVDDRHDGAPDGRSSLVHYLTDPAQRQRSTHPLFDTEVAHRQADEDPPFGPVAAWLATAHPDSAVPTPEGARPITLAEFRALAIGWANDEHHDSVGARETRSLRAPPPGAPQASDLPEDPPLVSVVVTTRNRSALLRDVIGSVQDQTWSAWELIIVDDESDDDTAALLAGAAHFEPRVMRVTGEGRGVPHARNLALARARGTYVAFLDLSHRWRADFLEVMVRQLEAHDWSMVHGILCDNSQDDPAYIAAGATGQELLDHPDLDLTTLVVRADLLSSTGGFDASLDGAFGLDLVLRLAERADLHLVQHVGVDRLKTPDDPYGFAEDAVNAWTSTVLSRRLLDWSAASAAPTVTGRISVVLPVVASQIHRAVVWINELGRVDHRLSGRADIELILIGSQLSPSQGRVLRTTAALHDSVRFVPVASPVSMSVATNIGATCSTGTRIVVVHAGVDPDTAALTRLAEVLADLGVDVTQPLVLDARGVVMSGGAVFADVTRPHPFLVGHAPADAMAAGQIAIPAPMGPVFAVRRDTFIDLEGLDPTFPDQLAEVDLGLRARGSIVMVATAQVTCRDADPLGRPTYVTAAQALERRWPEPPEGSRQAWGSAGFELVDQRSIEAGTRRRQPAGPTDKVFRVPRPIVRPRHAVRASVHESPPGLRWTIDTAVPRGPRAERWGDVHFARALAQSLTRQGQHVAVDARQARHRWSRDLDDVILVLRGLDEVEPRPGVLNVEWVISHPDLVTPEELRGFDLVYAASFTWSAQIAARWGIRVTPLLQCTDPDLFNVGRAEPDTGVPVLFVGNARNVYRSAVRSARAAGVDVALHGGGWEQFVPTEAIASELVPNADLGALYASAGIVLNDHWEDMRRDGFVSNRLFDATACGARVVTDEIEGVEALFGPQIRTFRTDADMASILAEGADGFPERATRVALASHVARDHSFDHRAGTLIADAVTHLKRLRDRP